MKSPNYQLHANGMTKFYQRTIFILIILLSSINLSAQQRAFPISSGAAAYVTGGRGGTVYHVTNLNNSGTGSFRDAVSASNRIIVFDVSGTVELTSNLSITADNLTIAGQSAPQGGITITGKVVYFQNVNNFIIRYIRFRPNYNSGGNVDALNAINCTNLMVDHCSVSWGGDEAFSIIGTSSNVTVQNSIFGESKTGMLAGDSNNAVSDDFSVIGNLWYNISHRFPNVNASRTDVINNVVHNWYTRLMVVSANNNTHLNEINNYYQSGNKTGATRSPNWAVNWLDIGGSSQRSNIRIYTDGNVYPSFLTEAGDDWSLYVHRFNVSGGAYAGTSQWDEANTDFQLASPLAFLGEAPTITTAAEALINVPLNAGANKYLNSDGSVGIYHDNVDSIYLTNVTNNTSESYSYPPTNIVNKQSYINFHNSVSNTPINSRGGSYYASSAHIPEIWLASNVPNGETAMDLAPSGYTWLEEFLNEIDGSDTSSNQVNAGQNATICETTFETLTASGAASYQWDTGETTASISVNPPITTSYSVIGTHSDGGTTNDNVTVTVNPMPVANAGDNVSTCIGTPVTLSAAGGTSYLWNTGATSQNITVNPNATTTYSVEVFQNDCSSIDPVTVTVNPMPDVDSGPDVTINIGESATLTATGANTYLWNTGETTASIIVNPIISTTYSVTGILNGCEATDTITVFSVDNSVTANAGQNSEICQGANTILTATGGSTYLWSTGGTTASITVNPSTTTTYTVTAYDASGTNSDTDDVIVTVNPMPVANAGADVSTCIAAPVTLSAAGGTSYLWSTGATSQNITVNPNSTTTYSVEVFQNNCSSMDEVIVNVNPLPNVDAGLDVTINLGENTTLNATGANTYLWDTGATSQSIIVSPNTSTTYTVTGFLNGCEAVDTITVTVVDIEVIANAGADISICEGQSSTLTATGGSTYLWSTGGTTASTTVNPSTTTIYTVTAYDASGTNSDTDDVIVTVNPMPVANAGADVSTCIAAPVTLSASGGTSYLWNTGATSQNITVNPNTTTTYSVEVFQNDCSSMDEVIVNVNPLPNVDAGLDVTINLGENTTLNATGANTYLWDTGATSQSIIVSPNTSTTYTVTGFLNGCEAVDTITVTVVDIEVIANAGADISICEGQSSTLTATGGSTYLWSTGGTTASTTVNPSTTTIYTVTAYDASGTNSDTDDVTVTVNPMPVANAGADVSTCIGAPVTLSASGGTSYLWNTGATSQNITVNPNTTTTYSVEVFQNDCSSMDEVIVNVNPLPNVDAGLDVTINLGENTTLNATGANTYLWDTGATSQSIIVSPNTSTTYTVTGFLNGCEAVDTIIVTVVDIEVIANAGVDETICQGYSVVLTASGGENYLWGTGETTQSITVNPIATSTYSVTVSSGNLQDVDDVTVFVNPNPNVIINNGNGITILDGEYITLSASGANSYQWNNGATQSNIAVNPSVTTTYSVTGFINNCTGFKEVVVNVVETVTAYAGENQDVCLGDTVILTATGGDNYLWSTGEVTQSISVSPEESTEYSVTVSNELDFDDATVLVNVSDCSTTELPGDPDAFDVVVHPNPTRGKINIKITGLNGIINLALFNVVGNMLHTESISNDGGGVIQIKLDLLNYEAGTYFLRLIHEGHVTTKQIILM